MNKNQKVLVVAAHPDDEVLGCGATMARHARSGDKVWVLILGQGVMSRYEIESGKTRKILEKLQASARRANQVLGVKKLLLEEFPDNAFDSVPRLKIIQAIERVVSQFRPDIVYTHSFADLNLDHQVCNESVQTACRPLPGAFVKKILTFEVASSTEWRFQGAKIFTPNYFVDAAQTLSLKLKAMKEYGDELRLFPHPRSLKYLEAQALVRGGQSGLAAAEAFCVVRDIQS